MSFVVRPGRESDLGMVYDSWAKDYADAPAVIGMVRMHYRRAIKGHIFECLTGASLQVACAGDDDDCILGWALFASTTLHYAYVKADVRKNGIFRALIEGAGIDGYSHKPRRWSPPNGWAHRPTWLEGGS